MNLQASRWKVIRAHQQVAKASRRFSVAKLDREAAWTAGGYTTRLDRAMAERRSSREEAVHSDTYEPSTSRPGRMLRQQSMLPCATRLPDPRAAALSQPIDSGEPSKPMGASSEDESRSYSDDNFSFSQRFAAMNSRLNGVTESGSSRAESFSSGDCPRAAIAAQSGGTKSFSIPRGDTQSSSSPRRPPSVESVSSATIMTADPDRTRAAVHI